MGNIGTLRAHLDELNHTEHVPERFHFFTQLIRSPRTVQECQDDPQDFSSLFTKHGQNQKTHPMKARQEQGSPCFLRLQRGDQEEYSIVACTFL